MKPGKLNIVMDGQWGSTGKGKLCAYLAKTHNVAVAICDFQTNAGHTIVSDEGIKHVFQQLPVTAAINPETQLLISPAATIDVAKLLQEIETHGVQDRLMIHPLAGIITQECVDYEKAALKRISSTLKGCGAATGMKAMRHPQMQLARDVKELLPFIGDTTEKLQLYLKSGAICMMETAQGFDLSLNHGHGYPYVTSRDITPASALNNAGVPAQLVGEIYGCLRTKPIRVGNMVENDQMIGSSGPYYPDQDEITWEQLQSESGAPDSLVERTTVTNKVRRVFTFSPLQFKRFMNVCAPTRLFINFINHVDYRDYGKRSHAELSSKARTFLDTIWDMCIGANYIGLNQPTISHIGTGEKMSDMIEL